MYIHLVDVPLSTLFKCISRWFWDNFMVLTSLQTRTNICKLMPFMCPIYCTSSINLSVSVTGHRPSGPWRSEILLLSQSGLMKQKFATHLKNVTNLLCHRWPSVKTPVSVRSCSGQSLVQMSFWGQEIVWNVSIPSQITLPRLLFLRNFRLVFGSQFVCLRL